MCEGAPFKVDALVLAMFLLPLLVFHLLIFLVIFSGILKLIK